MGGEFSQTFNSVGTATFASDPVDDYSTPSLILSGSIVVALPDDEELDIKIFYGDQEAVHFDENTINRIISQTGMSKNFDFCQFHISILLYKFVKFLVIKRF